MPQPVTTPVRDPLNRERPLSAIDDNRQAAEHRHLKPPGAAPAGTAAAAPAEEKKRRKVKPSSLCLTPPAFIQGSMGEYQRGMCIGEGGFARCFQVNDRNGELYAAKTLAKAALTTEKTRSKLITEIKLHRALDHPNIVKFIDCFEDRRNVYMLLEMCKNQSLADMVSRRRHLTEPEARYYFVECLGATHYMHSRGIVHRDMKLGNIFLDKDMHLKIGDFGLAARIQNRSRRYTVCGTPNYISPEVLQRPHAHSFETDVWALGIILYAMLVGRPPFQDRDIDVIYQRIRYHEPCFPPAPSQSVQEAWNLVSEPARDLVTRMLHPDPQARPSVRECLEHPFIQQGVFVKTIPTAALNEVVWLRATPQESAANLQQMIISTGLNKTQFARDQVETVSPDEVQHSSKDHVLPSSISPPSTRDKYKAVEVPSDSPAASQAEVQQVPVYDSPVVGRQVPGGADGRRANDHESPVVSRLRHEEPEDNTRRFRYPTATRTSTTGTGEAAPTAAKFGSMGASIASTRAPGAHAPARLMPRPSSTTSLNIVHTLRTSLRKTLANVRNALQEAPLPSRTGLSALAEAVEPPVIVTRWADFEDNWGISYTLSDGSVGMLYRDRTGMRMDPMFSTYMYYEARSKPGLLTMHRTAADTDDPRRRKKMDVLAYVRRYMDRELAHAVPFTRPGGDVPSGEILYYLTKSSECVVFVLTDGTLQFNFRDHFKAVVYDAGTKLALVTDQHQLFCWRMDDALVATQAAHFRRAALREKLAVIYTEAQRYYKSIE